MIVLCLATLLSLASPFPPPSPSPAFTSAEVAAFADSFFQTNLDSLHVPGAVFVLVQGDSVVFQRGYGYAHLVRQQPVDPAITLFQVASVSKLFTATAAMQQVEKGALDLQADVQRYLPDLNIDSSFDTPVTLAHLLTHTAGFDERNIGYMASDSASVRPLGTYLADRLPPVTRQPGSVTSYSNHGFGLIGHLVATTSGQPFERYVETNLLAPLGMTESTFHLPLPDTLAPHLAQGYRWNGTALAPTSLLYRNVPPAGAMSSTGADMARFMVAHLNGGTIEGQRILEPEAVDAMQRQQFTSRPRLPGMGYGFIELVHNGHRAIHHSGDVPGYRSLLVLLPDQDTGFFLAYNASSAALRRKMLDQFMDRFFPAPSPIPALSPREDTDLSPFTGTYVLNRYSRRSLEKLPGLFVHSFYVGADAEGFLVTQDGQRWVEVAPQVFRHAEEEKYLAFRTNEVGEITHLFRGLDLGGTFPGTYEKLAWYASPTFANEFYLSWIPFLLTTWLVWPIGAVMRFAWRTWKKQPPPTRTPGMIAARIAAALFGISAVWFAFGFVQQVVKQAHQGGGELLYGMPSSLARLLWLPLLDVVLGAALVAFAIQAWRQNYWRLAGRLHYTIFVLAALAWLVFCVQYNLIGFQY